MDEIIIIGIVSSTTHATTTKRAAKGKENDGTF
jgi:hypothetical protein